LKQDSLLFPFFFILKILCCRITAQIFFFLHSFYWQKREIADLPGRTSYPASFRAKSDNYGLKMCHYTTCQAASKQNENYQVMVVQKSSFEQQNVLSNCMGNSLLSNHGIPGDCAYTRGMKAHQGSGTVHCFPFEGVSESKQYLHLQAAKVTRSEYQIED
jgi:hypothetical protein